MDNSALLPGIVSESFSNESSTQLSPGYIPIETTVTYAVILKSIFQYIGTISLWINNNVSLFFCSNRIDDRYNAQRI